MPLKLFPSFLFYCIIAGITPGPANLCSLSTALKYGKRTALRQWRGIFCGFFIVSICSVFITYFIGTAFDKYVKWLTIIGAIYIIYLAIHLLIDKESDTKHGFKEGTFLNGVFVQVTNVKVIIFCITALTSYVLPNTSSFFTILAYGIFLPFTGPIENLVWLFAGVSLQGIFNKYRKPLNIAMALSLVLCAISILSI